jgi:CRP-like cAMP-binding protein
VTYSWAKHSQNRLLLALNTDDQIALSNYLEPVAFAAATELVTPNEPIRNVYFIEKGLVSVMAGARKGAVEVTSVGREGVLGLPVILGQAQTPFRARVQLPITALRMNADDLRTVMATRPAVHAALISYAHAVLVEVADTAFSACSLTIVQRLARFLLKLSDRVGDPDIPVTHDYLGAALGCRRSGVTSAIHVLEGVHAVRSARKILTVTDRDKLLQLSRGRYESGASH